MQCCIFYQKKILYKFQNHYNFNLKKNESFMKKHIMNLLKKIYKIYPEFCKNFKHYVFFYETSKKFK